jgi:hypothetical protein
VPLTLRRVVFVWIGRAWLEDVLIVWLPEPEVCLPDPDVCLPEEVFWTELGMEAAV